MAAAEEENAKVWQFKALKEDIEELKTGMRDVNITLQKLLLAQVTPEHLDRRVADVTSQYEARLNSEIKAIHLKYEPVYKIGIWVVCTLSLAVVGLIFNLLQEVLIKK